MNTYQVFYRRTAQLDMSTPKRVDPKDYEFVSPVDVPGHDPDHGDLEKVFRLMNLVDGDEIPMTLRVRSMSVGDVAIGPTGVGFYCASTGWVLVEAPNFIAEKCRSARTG